MNKILKFNVYIDGLENKIWRNIEISNNCTVADLAYVILASFDSLAYHLYSITHDGEYYYCGESTDLAQFDDAKYLKAIDTKLSEVDFSDSRMVMNYDFGSTTTFIINYIEEKDNDINNTFIYIANGEGVGMMDDESDEELALMVKDIDKKGESDYFYTMGYDDREYPYDYRNYDIDSDNNSLYERFLKIKKGYENFK